MRRHFALLALALMLASCRAHPGTETAGKSPEGLKPQIEPFVVPKLGLKERDVLEYTCTRKIASTGTEGGAKVDETVHHRLKGQAAVLYSRPGATWLIDNNYGAWYIRAQDPKAVEEALAKPGQSLRRLSFYSGAFADDRPVRDSGSIAKEPQGVSFPWDSALKLASSLEGKTLKRGDEFELDNPVALSCFMGMVSFLPYRSEVSALASVLRVPDSNHPTLLLSLSFKGCVQTWSGLKGIVQAGAEYEFDAASGLPTKVDASCRTTYKGSGRDSVPLDLAVLDVTTFDMARRGPEADPARHTLAAKAAPGDKVRGIVFLEGRELAGGVGGTLNFGQPVLEFVQVFGDKTRNLGDYNAQCRFIRAIDTAEVSNNQRRDFALLPHDGKQVEYTVQGARATCGDLKDPDTLKFLSLPGLVAGFLPPGPVGVHESWAVPEGRGFLIDVTPAGLATFYIFGEDSRRRPPVINQDHATVGIVDLRHNRLLSIAAGFFGEGHVDWMRHSFDWSDKVSLEEPTRAVLDGMEAKDRLMKAKSVNDPQAAYQEFMAAWKLWRGRPPVEMAEEFDRFAAICEKLKFHGIEVEVLERLCALQCTPDRHRRWVMALFNDRRIDLVAGAAEKYKEVPKDDAEWHLVLARSYVYKARYQEARKHLEEAAAIARKAPGPDAALRARIEFLTATALLNLGRFDAAAQTLMGCCTLDEATFNSLGGWTLMMEIKQAQKIGIYMRFKEPEFLPLGMYHLMKERGGMLPPFLELHLINGGSEDRVISFSTEVLDVTHESVDQFVLPGRPKEGEEQPRASYNIRVYQTPPIRSDFNVNRIIEEVEKPLRITLKERTDAGEKVWLQKTIPITIWPRRRIPLFIDDPEVQGHRQFFAPAIAAWVTPRAKFVEGLITDAKKHLKAGLEFYGGVVESAQKENVRAIYDYLKARGLSYVAHTTVYRKTYVCQDVRLPYDSFKTTNNLCIEGTVLFATAMEAIKIRPVIVLIPGHAFVAWHDERGPVQISGEGYYALETTVIASASFDEALRSGEETLSRHSGCFHARANCLVYPEVPMKDQMLDIFDLRREGYTPQPYPED